MDWGQPIANGNTAAVYLRDGRAIKVFDRRVAGGQAEREAGKQRIARACGIRVPEVYGVLRVDGRQAIVMEYVAGTPVGERMRACRDRADRDLALSVAIQVRMHAKSAPALETTKQKLAGQLLASEALGAGRRAALLDRLGRMPDGDRICHGDFHAFNLIATDSDVVVIDWVDASAGDPCADACRTHLLYAQRAPGLADPYLRHYLRQSGADREAVLAWMPIVAGARLSEDIPGDEAARLIEIVDGAL